MTTSRLHWTRLSGWDLIRLFWVFLAGLLISACNPSLVTTSTPTQTSTPMTAVTPSVSPTEKPAVTPSTGPTATPVPGISLLSPNGGEEWTEGQTYSVTWSAEGVETVSIEVATGGKPLGHIASDVPAGAGEYEWTIPEGFVSNFGPARSDVMRMRVYDSGDPNLFDENDEPFSVVAP